MSESNNRVECPNCGQSIDVNHILHQQVEGQLKKQFGEQLAKEKQRYHDQLEQLNQEQAVLEKAKLTQQAETELAIQKGMQARETELAITIKAKIEAEQSGQLEALNKELEEKTEKIKAYNRAKSEIERLKREKDELHDTIQAESELKLNKLISEERDKLRKNVEQKTQMDMAERDKIISDLNLQLKDAQRKAEQGSMQLQGEVQELAIEEILKEQFPLDTIEEIKKGAAGADCLQIIHTRAKQNCGTIYYESKRTKAFQQPWIEKFKQDIREKGADIGVLITQAMPADMERMGMREGVWICSFDEFHGLSLVLRDAAVRMSDAVASKENKGDKMGMLYDFLTSNEFRQQVEAIVEGFTQMQIDLDAEKRSMHSHWKKREKQIEKVLLNTNHMYGSVKGIAGNAIQSVPLLEIDQDTS